MSTTIHGEVLRSHDDLYSGLVADITSEARDFGDDDDDLELCAASSRLKDTINERPSDLVLDGAPIYGCRNTVAKKMRHFVRSKGKGSIQELIL